MKGLYKSIKRELIVTLARLHFFGNPSKKIKVIGITGTNGKTTIATLLYQLFRNMGYKVGMIGTVVNKINDESIDASHTTPDPVKLHELLNKMVKAGCKYCFMEVSSHAMDQNRVAGIKFAGGVFTNLTHDHLDYHKNFENYFHAKKKFFQMLPKAAFALSNIDDKYGRQMIHDIQAKKYLYSLKSEANFTDRLETQLIGDFNAYNMLAIYATAVLLGEDKDKIKEEIKKLEPVAGRFQYIKSLPAQAGNNHITGVVDYAHTPDALENVLRTINSMKKEGRVISVFGCGGNRDKTKRPIMAKIGYDMSDIVILTSDNPRNEKPEDILEDMKKGLPASIADKVYIIANRHEAIEKACSLAHEGDYVLVAGKGHENYQEVDGVKNHFDDMEELRKCLK